MTLSLFDIIKRDAKYIVNSGGYQIDITFTNLDKSKTVTIQGWAVKVVNFFDTDGNQVNTKKVQCTFDELALVNQGYPVRTNKKGIEEVDLIGHYVSFVDSSDGLKNYKVRENLPDENLGLITIWCGDYRES